MAQEAYDPERSAVSRRTMLRSVGAAVGVAVLAPRLAGAQTPPAGPPSTITQPPRDFSPRGAPTTYFTDPDVLTVRAGLRRAPAAQRADPAPVDGRALGGGAGVERAGPLPGVERHPQQPAAALDRGRRARQRVPHAVEQQQRQHLRLPGSAALLRARHPARGALRARRLDQRSSRSSSTASGSTRRTTSCRIRTAATGSPIRRTAAQLYEGTVDAAGGPANTGGPAQPEARAAARARLLQARAAHRGVPRRPERHARPRWWARTRCRTRTGSASRRTTRSST